jgi:hypothetical protein
MHLKALEDIQLKKVSNKNNSVPHKEDAARIFKNFRKHRKEKQRARDAVS